MHVSSKTMPQQSSHQASKIKFSDIPDRFLKIPDGASSAYHFSGQLHLPHTDPLAITFQCKYHCNVTVFFYSVIVFIVSYKCKQHLTAKNCLSTSKIPRHSCQNRNFWHSLISIKWEPCSVMLSMACSCSEPSVIYPQSNMSVSLARCKWKWSNDQLLLTHCKPGNTVHLSRSGIDCHSLLRLLFHTATHYCLSMYGQWTFFVVARLSGNLCWTICVTHSSLSTVKVAVRHTLVFRVPMYLVW